MARIVPARPKKEEKKIKIDTVQFFENKLSDDFIIFQSLGEDASLLFGGQGKPWTLVIPIEDVLNLDATSGKVSTTSCDVELNEASKLSLEALKKFRVDEAKVAYLLSPIEGHGGERLSSENFVCFWSMDDLKMYLEDGSSPVSVAQVDDVLSRLSEGASRYEPGTITEAQADWRMSQSSIADEDGFTPEVSVTAGDVVRPLPVRRPDETVVLNRSSSQRVQYVEDLVRSLVSNLQGDRAIFSCGVEIDADFVAGADALLPVVIIAASDQWSTVVAKASGIGGFDARMVRDPEALVGMRVVDILASSPFLLFMPLAKIFKSTLSGEEFETDRLLGIFARWVQNNDLNDIHLDDIEVNVAIRAIDGE